MSTVNPTRAEESACTREMASQVRLLAHPPTTYDRVTPATVADCNLAFSHIYEALERVSRRVDAERAARDRLVSILWSYIPDRTIQALLLETIGGENGE